MRSTFKILPYINRKRIKSDGTTAVLCRVSIDGKSILITTGIFCRPEDWNSQTGTIRQPRENNRLAEFRLNLERAYDRLLKEQGAVSAELLKNAVTGVATIPQTLLKGGEAERERLRLRAEQIHSTSTFRQSKTTQLNLQQFLQSRGLEDIAFSDITEEFGHSFKLFLKKELGYASGHVNHCLCWLNRLIYIAVDEGVLRCNPLEDVHYEKKDPPKMRHISRSELKRLMATPMPDPKVELARRMFIFSSLTGLAYADVYNLYPRHIGKTSEGRLYIRKPREKTEVETFVPLHPAARQILELYNTTDDTRPVFPPAQAGHPLVRHSRAGCHAGHPEEPFPSRRKAHLRYPFGLRGHFHRKRGEDDGPCRHQQHPDLCADYRLQDIEGHGPSDGTAQQPERNANG
ncbi:tyrosine type site-specific recombinase [Bacteroides eggerthii 1_2_48FAA]|uniref:Tyrosine type site-specific recombinase n=1 Tax=Bacteroides eggerthii 1_2_48FAA TaxID=665953 RepID=E5WU45_9BACE|nr:tyrosine type site-specific recombinase [Bacteroides eggerthii 1_2_48FAA]